MNLPSRLRARLRNAVLRTVKRVPHNAISTAVRNDRFLAHESLFEFLAAFTSQRRTLFVGTDAHGAHALRQGAASVTAVLSSSTAIRHGRRTYATQGLEFRSSLDGARHDVVIHTGAPHNLDAITNALESNGKLLIALAPSQDDGRVRDALQSRFANVRRFAHVSTTPLDFASPLFSVVPRHALSFHELALDARVEGSALDIIYLATNDPKWRDLQLHLGCGPLALDGWINIDNQPYAGIDFRWDLARGIPFRNARYVFAEHFIEHLSYAQGMEFTRNCRAAMRDDGILRLSTPNLDWVWQVCYHPGTWTNEDEPLRECFVVNRAFRGWGHQFLYNRTTLAALLQNAGFADVRALRYGESDTPALAGLERHEQYPDSPELPHVLVIEASGRNHAPVIRGEANIAEYLRDVATV